MSSDHPDMARGGPDDDALAAEYALNLLGVGERARFEERLAVEGALRTRVDAWIERLVPLAEDIDPVAPPDRVRGYLENFARGETAVTPARRRRSFSVAQLLRGTIGGALVAAAAFVILAVIVPIVDAPSPGPVFTAELTADDGARVVAARFNPREDVLRLDGLGIEAPSGRVLQLWLLPEGADTPLSLGLLPPGRDFTVPLSPEAAAGIPGGLLEISEEPPGGSPEAGPTGSVLAIGEVEDA